MVVTGTMLGAVFIFCCLVCRAKAVGGDERGGSIVNGAVHRRRDPNFNRSPVPPPPPPPLTNTLDPQYPEFDVKNYPPPPPYSP